MAAFLFNPLPTPMFNSVGQFASGAKAFFYEAGTTTPLIVFSDGNLDNELPFPVIASNLGIFKPIYVPFVSFRVRILDSNNVVIVDEDNISNPPPPAGGGIVVTADELFQTGDPLWRLRSGLMQGWVRMNGNTIGSASSGATELASATAQDLFTFIWTNFADTLAPVVGGRGTSASADWVLNKQITIPSMQGCVGAGVDDMGGTAAGAIQANTTVSSVPAINDTIGLASIAGIQLGDMALIAGVANGHIIAIQTTPPAVTLDTAIAAHTAGTAFVAQNPNGATDATTTTGTITSSGASLVLASVQGLGVGMNAILAGVANGVIIAINAATLTITLSVAVPTSTASGATFRASFFVDAQIVGNTSGSDVADLTADQLPPHTHPIHDPGHSHGYSRPLGQVNFTASGGSLTASNPVTENGGTTNAAVTGITVLGSGNGNPLSILQPTRLGYWFMKL